jgi:hypothetical protein
VTTASTLLCRRGKISNGTESLTGPMRVDIVLLDPYDD